MIAHGLMPLDRRGDRCLVGDVEFGADGQHMRQAAMRANPRERLAKRARRAGDQDRTGGSVAPRRQRVVARPRVTSGPGRFHQPGRSSSGWSIVSPRPSFAAAFATKVGRGASERVSNAPTS